MTTLLTTRRRRLLDEYGFTGTFYIAQHYQMPRVIMPGSALRMQRWYLLIAEDKSGNRPQK